MLWSSSKCSHDGHGSDGDDAAMSVAMKKEAV